MTKRATSICQRCTSPGCTGSLSQDGSVYFPPLLIAALLGFFLAWLTAQMLNRYRLSRFFFYSPRVLLALAVIYTVLLGTLVIPS